MSKTKLRPCPFCGGDEIEAGTVGYAYCINCDAEGPHTKTKATAIRAWNDRPGNTINEQIGCLVDIRRVVGDPEAKLMQSELVECIALLVADAALGRAVRCFTEGMALFRQNTEWAFRQGYAGNIVRSETPEAALRAAGLMKEEKGEQENHR